MKKTTLILLISGIMLAFGAGASAQSLQESFKPVGDSLTVLARQRFSVRSSLRIRKAMKRSGSLDLYFSREFSDFPWREDDIRWLRHALKAQWPEQAQGYPLGAIFCEGSQKAEDLVTPGLSAEGKPLPYKFAYTDHKAPGPFVEQIGGKSFAKGLSNRTVALWQSHGLFWDQNPGLWGWQRTPLFGTIEDMYTQSYVLPFLIPMLENAGAYVMTPRERSTQIHEVVCDNDRSYQGSNREEFAASDWEFIFGEPLPARTHGAYSENGAWSDAGQGFADTREIYSPAQNPFTEGSARKASCTTGKANASARWTPLIPETGSYPVYISYKSIPGSSKSAHYTVHHMGGDTRFAVDQTRGGGTWVYLGTFDFEKGSEGYVQVDNGTPKGHQGGSFVTADAVRFGGGRSKIARGDNAPYVYSGVPAFMEGALYSMQWAGVPDSVTDEWDNDYTRDYASRGAWVRWMKDDLDVPVDMSLAWHTDAGVTPDDSIIGTLSIYTLIADGSRRYSNGKDRLAGRYLADCVQTQVCDDVRAKYDSVWTRRQLWDRSYSESRTTDVPGMLLEFLSHQNFADMKFGMDPRFRFDVSRGVYKGMLKFMGSYYGYPVVVQPLPVAEFAARLSGEQVQLSWQAVSDPLEATADPKGYVVYTRIDGKGWDDGKTVKGNSVSLPVQAGHIYSYKVVAFNEGGYSFPSEVLSVGKPAGESKGKALIVNNFTRVSGPAYIDTPQYAGFNRALDSGVAWGQEINFIGDEYEQRRDREYVSNSEPGFGSCYTDKAGMPYAGNSFDYPAVHGKALLDLGYEFSSCSQAAFAQDPGAYQVIDLICGKQVATTIGTNEKPSEFRIFPAPLQQSLRSATAAGANLIVSGAYIATEGHDSVFPVKDEDFADYQKSVRELGEQVLGIKFVTSRGSKDGVVRSAPRLADKDAAAFEYWHEINPECYPVENPNGFRPANAKGKTVLWYRSTNIGAAVHYNAGTYKAATFGFPLEALKSNEQVKSLMESALSFFEEKN